MKIDTSYKLPPTPGSHNASKPEAAGAQGDQVRLSEASRPASAAPPVNVSKVEEIKQAIAEGRFKTNPEAIADRLITLSQELIALQRNT